ncbi:MAG: dTDP-glucose 4,6-dehydratase [Kiritimatiellia bacterium]|jgi:dTDP-glucose 4,6-dehydratase|nr:dTDP-glucose 4,6-dehydratase [Kiritimatiellia bacterium]
MRFMVTGGSGFIGSSFLYQFAPVYSENVFINVDRLTYAANPLSLSAIESVDNYVFEHVDIADRRAVEDLLDRQRPDVVVHFAAESHVDRSLTGPSEFVTTNINGTFNLLEGCRRVWGRDLESRRFHHVSTDEVYGELGSDGKFREDTPYCPSSPYSATKAGSDHLVRAYHRSYGLPITITNCSNNYGPRQFPEKLIPLMILNAIEGKPLPVYGNGSNVRDWLHVEDHCRAIWRVVEKGVPGETYNVGGNCELTNLEVVRAICRAVANETGVDEQQVPDLVTFVTDRPGHDFRYAIDASKIADELNWEPEWDFESGLRATVRWYLENAGWVGAARSQCYENWIEENYGQRGEEGPRAS